MVEVQPGLYILASKLGWILTGRTSEPNSNANETTRRPDLEDVWNVETIAVLDNPNSTND